MKSSPVGGKDVLVIQERDREPQWRQTVSDPPNPPFLTKRRTTIGHLSALALSAHP